MLNRSRPGWWRMLGWGLLASLMLHWIAFDLMRVADWPPPVLPKGALQVRLRTHESGFPSRASSQEAASLSLSPSLAPAPVPQRKLLREVTSDKLVANTEAKATPGPLQPEQRAVALTQIEGLRSAQPTEAMVGLRLALAQRLTSTQVMPGTSTVWCDFDATGRLLEVRGTPDLALQASVRQAVGQVVMPAVLVGKVFSLDLLLESD